MWCERTGCGGGSLGVNEVIGWCKTPVALVQFFWPLAVFMLHDTPSSWGGWSMAHSSEDGYMAI